MNTETLFNLLKARMSAPRILDSAKAIYDNDRWNSFDKYRQTADYIFEQFRDAGADDVQRFAIPCDGQYTFGDWVMPLAWDAEEGILELLDDNEGAAGVLADYQSVPNNLIRWSRPTADGGEILELIHLPAADKETSWREADVTGKLVFIHTDADKAYPLACAHGAVGIVTDFSTAPEAFPDAVHWCNVWTDLRLWGTTKSDEPLLGFCLTPQMGKFLRKAVEELAAPVRVRALVKSRFYQGTTDVITAAILGSEKPNEEIVFYAHAYECHIDDNAVSVASYIEMVRIMKQLMEAERMARPRRTIRFVVGWEWVGSDFYAANCKQNATWIASICHDGLATRQDLTQSPVELHTSPFFSTSFADALFLELWEQYFAANCPATKWREEPWTGGTDTTWVDPDLAGVSNVYPFQACGPTWHKSGSSISDIEPKVAVHSGLTSLLWALCIANATSAEAEEFSRISLGKMLQEVRQHGRNFNCVRPDTDDARRQLSREQHYLRRKTCRRIDTTILAPDDALIRKVNKENLQKVQSALAEEKERVNEKLLAAEEQLPDWEAKRPLHLVRAQAERLAENVVVERHFSKPLRSMSRLPAGTRKLTKPNALVQFQTDGKQSLLDLVQAAEFDQQFACDLRSEIRMIRALDKAGYVTRHFRKTFGRDDLITGLRSLGVNAGDTVLVHSSLASLGPMANGAETIFDALEGAVAPDGTIVFPSFAFNTLRQYPEEPYDVESTPSRVGSLTNLFWKRDGVLRSLHPSHGLAAEGPRARYVIENVRDKPPFDFEGSFGRLYALDAKVLMLGCGLAPNTTLHVIEDWADLPSMQPDKYHYLDPNGNPREIVYQKVPFYPRDFYTAHTSSYERLFREKGLLRDGKVGLAISFLMRVRDILDVGIEEIRNRRFGILFDSNCKDHGLQAVLADLYLKWTFPPHALSQMVKLQRSVTSKICPTSVTTSLV